MRIVIVGLPGAGKTSLAKKIAAREGLPHIEADQLFWRTNDLGEFREQVDRLTQTTHWVYEGHLSKVLGSLIHRADFWVELTPKSSLCFYRMARREMRAFLNNPRETAPLQRFLFNAFHWRGLKKRQREILLLIKDRPHRDYPQKKGRPHRSRPVSLISVA